MAIRIFNSQSPLTDSAVESFEKELGVRLPNDYRHFLLQHNGGRVVPPYYRMQSMSGEDSIGELQFLFSIFPGSALDLRWVRNTAQGRVPRPRSRRRTGEPRRMQRRGQ